jgi:hypothetical protein
MIAHCTFRPSCPGGGVGERSPHSFGFRNSASGEPERIHLVAFKVIALGQRIWEPKRLCLFLPAEGTESPLAGRLAAHFQSLSPVLFGIPAHSRESEFPPWDCKVTPASCACQEGNTTGCIPNNDGLDAGPVPRFPHRGERTAVAVC